VIFIDGNAVRYGRTAAILVAVASLAGLAACSGSSQSSGLTVTFPGAAKPSGTWAQPNGDLANTRDATGSVISSRNVASLREAWSFKLSGTAALGVSNTGAFAAAPVVAGGTVYIQDLDANVYAVSLATGKLDWEYPVDIPEKSGPGPDGVAVAGGMVYGDTSTAVFALNAATGKVIWNDTSLLNSGQGSFEIQPAVADGRVYLASAYGSGPGGGILLALDAATGKELWSFSTVASGQPAGVRSLGLGSAGAWQTPLVGTDGSVTFGTGNPYQSLGQAISHPSRDLYTDSEVNLDAATGKLRWYYQAEPDDFRDWDLQLSPIAVTVRGAPAIVSGGKMGDVYAFGASSGKLLWKTPVGVHDGHDNDSALMLSHRIKVKLPYTYEPGALGGVLTNMAAADGSVYLATIDLPFTETKLSEVNGSPIQAPTGEIEALSLDSGKVEWDTRVPTMALGAATVSNDLIVTTLYNGVLIALNKATGAIVARKKLPTSTNAPIAIAGNTIIVPAGGPAVTKKGNAVNPQLVAYTVGAG